MWNISPPGYEVAVWLFMNISNAILFWKDSIFSNFFITGIFVYNIFKFFYIHEIVMILLYNS